MADILIYEPNSPQDSVYSASRLRSNRLNSANWPSMDPDAVKAITHFKTIPWCARLLEDDGSLTVHVSPNRTVLPGLENKFIASTINSNSTISNWVLLYKRPVIKNSGIETLNALISLEEGMTGFPGSLHGGLVSVIFDEVAGLHIVLDGHNPGTELDKSFRTAYINTSFMKPVPTPATVLVRSWIAKVEGRKHWVRAQIEDGNRQALARAEVLYISIKSKL